MSAVSSIFAIMVWLPAVAPLNPWVCEGWGDFDGDARVTLEDFAVFVRCLGADEITNPPAECDPSAIRVADFDRDGRVTLRDFAVLSNRMALAYFDYGPHRENLEAEMLALVLSEEIRAPDELYDRIARDLRLIREEFPDLEEVVNLVPYSPNQLLVGLKHSASNGTLDELNAFYRVVDVRDIQPISVVILTFCDTLNAQVVKSSYQALPDVTFAEPDETFGDGNHITVIPMASAFRYVFDEGSGDCRFGCQHHRLWTIDVDEGGTVTLISVEDF